MNKQELKIVCIQYRYTTFPAVGQGSKIRSGITFKEPFAGQFVYRPHPDTVFDPIAVWRLKSLKNPVGEDASSEYKRSIFEPLMPLMDCFHGLKELSDAVMRRGASKKNTGSGT